MHNAGSGTHPAAGENSRSGVDDQLRSARAGRSAPVPALEPVVEVPSTFVRMRLLVMPLPDSLPPASSRACRGGPGSFSVSVTMNYRAIFFLDGPVNVWYWIGTHADYDRFTGA